MLAGVFPNHQLVGKASRRIAKSLPRAFMERGIANRLAALGRHYDGIPAASPPQRPPILFAMRLIVNS